MTFATKSSKYMKKKEFRCKTEDRRHKKPVQFISLSHSNKIIIDIGSWNRMEKPAIIRYAFNIEHWMKTMKFEQKTMLKMWKTCRIMLSHELVASTFCMTIAFPLLFCFFFLFIFLSLSLSLCCVSFVLAIRWWWCLWLKLDFFLLVNIAGTHWQLTHSV